MGSLMVNKIAYINGKGGCGKTTSIFHTAGVLSKQEEKVLVIDFDKQRNTSDTLLMNTKFPERTVLDVMLQRAELTEAVQQALFQTRGNATAKYYGVDCLVADVGLEDESVLAGVDGASFGDKLDQFIADQGYTWVLVDMPPSNKALNDICFGYVVDYVIVPFSSDIFSVTGYADIMETIDNARTKNPTLNIIGLYLARYMRNCEVDRYIRGELSKYDTFIDVQVPLKADVREAILYGRPISYYKMVSDSKTAYENLVKQMVVRINKLRQ